MSSRIHRPGRMPVWQRWCVLTGMSLCVISGLLFLLGHEFRIAPSWFGSRVVLTTHGVTASLAIFLFGSVIVGHVRVGLSFRRQIWTGLTNLAALTFLILTSWVLYYGNEEWREDTVFIHWLVGLLFAVIFTAHLVPLFREVLLSRHQMKK